METLKHENYDELMGFVTEVYTEIIKPGSEIKRVLQLVGAPAPEAFQQCMMEVRQQDGGFGASHMSAKDWFNNDYVGRQKWADQIAATYELYKADKEAEIVAEANPVADELKALREEVAALSAKLKEADAAVADKKKAPADEEETPAEDAAETPADEEAEGEDAKAKSKKGE